LASYRQLLTLHVLPVLGSLKKRDIRRRHITGLLMSKRAGRLQPERGKGAEHRKNNSYSKNTVRLINAALSSVLTDAIDDGSSRAIPSKSRCTARCCDSTTSWADETLHSISPNVA
jgi:hypothetical protein